MNDNQAWELIEKYKENLFSPEFISDEEAEYLCKYIADLKCKSEKQEPKKLFGNKYNPIHFGETVSGLCPVCLTEFICITPMYYRANGYGYCKECGQKIDLDPESYSK